MYLLVFGKVYIHYRFILTHLFFHFSELQIEPEDVGDVYKIRVSCDDLPDFEGWHLKSFHMEELHTNQAVNFDCNCWFSHSQEHGLLVKEFPAVNENQKSLPGKNSKGRNNTN